MIFNEFNIQVQAKDEEWLRSAALQTLFMNWKIDIALIQPVKTLSTSMKTSSMKINEKMRYVSKLPEIFQ